MRYEEYEIFGDSCRRTLTDTNPATKMALGSRATRLLRFVGDLAHPEASR